MFRASAIKANVFNELTQKTEGFLVRGLGEQHSCGWFRDSSERQAMKSNEWIVVLVLMFPSRTETPHHVWLLKS